MKEAGRFISLVRTEIFTFPVLGGFEFFSKYTWTARTLNHSGEGFESQQSEMDEQQQTSSLSVSLLLLLFLK